MERGGSGFGPECEGHPFSFFGGRLLHGIQRIAQWCVRVVIVSRAVCLLGQAGAAPANPPLKLSAKAAVVIDADSGRLLLAVHPDEPLPPASTTKIVSGMLFAQAVPPDRLIPISSNAASLPGDRLGLRAGEKVPARDLLYAMLLVSANDAAEAAAEGENGILEGKQGVFEAKNAPVAPFVGLMNALAQKVGAYHSHFMNPTGLPAPGQVSTARDLALLARAALSVPAFAQAVRTKTYVLRLPGESRPRVLVNTNRLLWTLPGAYGVKTGYTKEAGFCYVGAAAQQGHRIIVVLLHSNSWQTEALALFRYGFERLSGVRPWRPSANNERPEGYGGGDMPASGQAVHQNGRAVPHSEAGRDGRAFPTASPKGRRSGAHPERRGGVENPETGGREEPTTGNPGKPVSPIRRVPVTGEAVSRAASTDRGAFKQVMAYRLLRVLGALLLAAAMVVCWRRRRQWRGGVPMWLVGLSRRRKATRREPAAPLLPAVSVSEGEAPQFQWEGLQLARRTVWEWLELLLERPIRVLEPPIRWHLRSLLQADPSLERGRFRKILESHESVRVRLAMAEALEALAPRAVEKCARQLLEGEGISSDIRAEAAERLGAVGGERYEHFWLERLLKEPSSWAALALLRLVWLDNSTVQALMQALEMPLPEGASAELIARRQLRDGYIACVLFGHALMEEEEFLERFRWLPEEVQSELLVALGQKGREADRAYLLLKRFLASPSYGLLRALCDMPPDAVEDALNALDSSLHGAEATRAEVVRWLLGKGTTATLEEMRRLAEAGDDAAAHALQLQRVVQWNPSLCAPDALLAAAQIVSCRLGYLYYDPDYVTQVLRNALNEENVLPAGAPEELKALAMAYRNQEVHDAVFATMQSEENLLQLLMTLSRYVAEEARYAQEVAFWCTKLPAEARYALLWSLERATDPATFAAIEDALSDANPFVRSTARRLRRLGGEPLKADELKQAVEETAGTEEGFEQAA